VPFGRERRDSTRVVRRGGEVNLGCCVCWGGVVDQDRGLFKAPVPRW